MSGIMQMLLGTTADTVNFEIYGVQSTHAFASDSSSSVTVNNAGLGTAHSDREIWVVISWFEDSAINTSSVTVGGNSATKKFEESSDATYHTGLSYWRYTDNGSLGSTADIVANFSGAVLHTGILVFTASKPSYVIDTYSAQGTDGNATTGSIDTIKSGWSFYCAICQNASSATIAGFGNDGSFDAGTGEWVTYGYNSPEDDGTVSVGLPSSTGTQAITISGISVSAGAPLGLSPSLLTVSGENAVWTSHTLDISDYANATVRLVFRYQNGSVASSYHGDIQLDTIDIDGNSYGFEEGSNHSFQTSNGGSPSTYGAVTWVSVPANATAEFFNVHTGTTSSSSTGNLGAQSGSYFIYAETSSPVSQGDYIWCRSPSLSLSSDPTLTFWEGREGANIGTLDVFLDVEN